MTFAKSALMKILKICISCLLAILAMISPFAIVIGAATLTPSQYSNAFVGALNEKYDRLYSIEEEKIVIVGGSSVAFGVDSAMIEKYTGMPVVNFGLYAALGTKLMLDLSRGAIGEGDIVILSPEGEEVYERIVDQNGFHPKDREALSSGIDFSELEEAMSAVYDLIS